MKRAPRRARAIRGWGIASMAAALVAPLALSAACGSVFGEAAPTTDGGGAESEGPDAADAMALGEAASIDASDSDADGGSDAATLSICDALRGDSGADDFFCTDFEDVPASGPTSWTYVNANNAATFLIAGDAGVDGSRAFDVLVSGSASAAADSRLRATLPPTREANAYAHYQLDFDVRVVTMSGSYEALGALVFTAGSANTNGIGDFDVGNGLFALSHETSGSTPNKRVPNDTAWHHARVMLDRDAAGTYARSHFIDAVDVNEDLSARAVANAAGTEVWLGVFQGNLGTGLVHVQFDNVVLRRRLN